MNIGGIYTIKHQSGRVYVGSAVNIKVRWIHHKNRLRAGRHGNIVLQRSWNKYGEGAFEFAILDPVIDRALLLQREQHWIDALRSVGSRGFNLLPTAGSHLGRKRSKKTKALLSASALGNKRGVGNTANLGRKLSPETCARMSASRMGNKYSVGNKNHLGHKHNEEARKKISVRQKGIPKPALAAALKIYYASPERRALLTERGRKGHLARGYNV